MLNLISFCNTCKRWKQQLRLKEHFLIALVWWSVKAILLDPIFLYVLFELDDHLEISIFIGPTLVKEQIDQKEREIPHAACLHFHRILTPSLEVQPYLHKAMVFHFLCFSLAISCAVNWIYFFHLWVVEAS